MEHGQLTVYKTSFGDDTSHQTINTKDNIQTWSFTGKLQAFKKASILNDLGIHSVSFMRTRYSDFATKRDEHNFFTSDSENDRNIFNVNNLTQRSCKND